MAGDGLSLALFGLRIGLNLSVLLMTGLALHGALRVVERGAFKRYRIVLLITATATITLSASRIVFLNVQMGDGATAFDPDLTGLSWLVLGPSTLAFGIGACVVGLGALTNRRTLLALGAVVTVGGFALTGHTQALANPGVMPWAASLHALIGGFWIVAPLTLWPATSLGNDELLRRLHRFSAVAVAAIPVLLGLGVWLAWTLARGWDGLIGSAYGQLLLVKLAAGLAAMGMGAINKQYLTAKVADQPERGRRWLRYALAIETALFAAAIVAVSAATTLTGAGE